MTTSLVTGGAGFIGSHLVRYLERAGHKVRVISRDKNEDFSRVPDMRRILEKTRYDYVFHLAAAGTLDNHAGGQELLKTNILGSYDFYQLLREYDVRGIINIGSSSEYGSGRRPSKETVSPVPTFLFASTKAAMTMIASALAREQDLPIVTVRPFAVYGPGDRSNRFIPTVIQSALAGKEIHLYPGVHDWVYVEDVVHAITKLAETAKQSKGQVFNVGTEKKTTNKAVIKIVSSLTKLNISVQQKNNVLRSYDANYWIADTTKLRSIIQWNPLSLEEGLKKTIAWYVGH